VPIRIGLVPRLRPVPHIARMLVADRAVFHTTVAGLEDDSVAGRLGDKLGA